MQAMDQPNYGGPEKRRSGDDSESPAAKRQMPDLNPQPLTYTLRCLVSSSDAGGIIGKGGSFIRRLREMPGSGVLLPDSLGAPERVLSVSGPLDVIVNIMQLVLPKIGEFDRQRAGESGASYRSSVQLLFPEMQVGSIIGRGGLRIKELRDTTGVHIKVHSDTLPNCEERLVVISGNDENIISCLRRLLDMVAESPLRNEPTLYDPSAQAGDYYGHGGYGRHHGGDYPPSGYGGSYDGYGRGGNRGGFSRGAGSARGGGYNRGMARGDFDGGFRSQGPVSGAPPSLARGRGMGRAAPPVSGSSWSSFGATQHPGFPDAAGMAMGGDGQHLPSLAPSGTPDDGVKTEQVTIPNEYAGAIIGPQGVRVRQVRDESGCVIHIDDMRPGSSDRVITITGRPDSIRYAQHMMQQSVYQHMNSRGGGRGRGGSSRGNRGREASHRH